MANGLFNLKQVMQGIQQGGWNGQKPPAVEYLVVAGGGGGGRYNGGGGGGAGGLLAGIDPVPNGQTLLVTVGGGGAGGTNSGTGQGVSGSNSVFGTISSVGGGGGGGSDVPSPPTYNYGASGGSGGGSGTNGVGFVAGGQGTFGQGNAGGRGNSDAASWRHGGGGGGAGTVGFDVLSGTSGGYGNGGAGIASAINGTVTAYAGGGGGGVYVGYSSVGGVGGGGAGGNSSGTSATAGTANTGGGGGGGGGASGAAGGSGIVIISYPDTYAAATATTGSPTVSTSGSGSIYFNGSSALTYPTSSAFAFGTGDFTVEFWAYATSLPTYAWFFDFYTPSGYVGLPFNVNFYAPTSKIRYESNSGDRIIGTTTISINTWYHVAICRSGTTTTMYVNGSSNGSYSDTYNYVLPTNSQPVIGSRGNYGYPLYGYMSNVRVVKGTALYTGSFTPSTTPLTSVSGTSLLLNTVSGAYAADGSGNGFGATATGTPAWNASSPFTVTGYKNRVYTWTSSGSITF